MLIAADDYRPASPAPQSSVRDDLDRDSLHVLPLRIIPLSLNGLRRARMIKNARLNTAIEFFEDAAAGSGQLEIGSVAKEFGLKEGNAHPDVVLLQKLAPLPSFDVYSLRILLRENGIAVTDAAALSLSPAKVGELTAQMMAFTRPLIAEVYGNDGIRVETFEDVVGLFRSPDVGMVRHRLKTMADKLEIGMAEIPRFLEDYGDIALSLSYYRHCLDAIMPTIEGFLESLADIRENFQMRHDQNVMATCDMMESTFNGLMASITGRLENFDRSTADMWRNLNGERFRKISRLIRNYHTSIGGVLCALTVKMDAWSRLFPDPSAGGPVRKAEFIVTELRQGVDRIQQIEDSAPMLASIN